VNKLKIDNFMNRLKYYMEIVLILSIFGINCCNASSQPKQIELSANGWLLTIKPDGSAGISRIKESNAIFSTASTAPGAVDFEKIKESLDANSGSLDSTKVETHLQAGIRMEGQDSIILKPVNDIKIWNQLIVQLEPKWKGPMLSSFKKAVEKNPLTIILR
jgi:hypothetical protein